jgi:hypothetical protein
MPVKQIDPQAVMKTHLSQSTGSGAFDGQHGISLATSPVMAMAMAMADISSGIACCEPCEDAAAMTGRETGANARPAIIRTASSRRMVNLKCTEPGFSNLCYVRRPSFDKDLVAPDTALFGIVHIVCWTGIDRNQCHLTIMAIGDLRRSIPLPRSDKSSANP